MSQAISEGDAISVLVEIAAPEAARAAARQGADGVVLRRSAPSAREATELPLVWCADGPAAAEAAGADAYLLVAARYGDDWERLAADYGETLGRGLDCLVEVRDEEELEEVLERIDPEILLLAGTPTDPDAAVLDHLLELLPDVPAGKLAVAHLAAASREDVDALERAGIDAVVVDSTDVRSLVGDEPPAV